MHRCKPLQSPASSLTPTDPLVMQIHKGRLDTAEALLWTVSGCWSAEICGGVERADGGHWATASRGRPSRILGSFFSNHAIFHKGEGIPRKKNKVRAHRRVKLVIFAVLYFLLTEVLCPHMQACQFFAHRWWILVGRFVRCEKDQNCVRIYFFPFLFAFLKKWNLQNENFSGIVRNQNKLLFFCFVCWWTITWKKPVQGSKTVS